MHSTLPPKPSDDPHDVVVVAPDAVRVAPSDDELSGLLQQAARCRSDAPTLAAPDVAADAKIPAVDTTFRPAAVNDGQVAGQRWSIARQAARAFTALLVATCIGGATFAWRAYGDTAERKITKWATQFVLTVSAPAEKPELAADAAAPAIAADAAAAQPAAPAQTAAEAAAPAAAAPASDQAQLLQSMARDLASLGQQVEQLKAGMEQLKTNQQQVSRDVTKSSEVKASEAKASEVRVSEPNSRTRISALPPRPAAARPRKPMPPYLPPQAAAPALPPVAAPYPAPAPYYGPRQNDYVPRQVEPQPEVATQTLGDPELASVPRPPMPLR
jgi:hypothetical protein